MRPVPDTPVRAATICADVVPIEACDAAKAAEPTGLLLTPTLPMVFDPAASAEGSRRCRCSRSRSASPRRSARPVHGERRSGADVESRRRREGRQRASKRPRDACSRRDEKGSAAVILLPSPSSMTTPSVMEPSGFFHCMLNSPHWTRVRDHAGKSLRVDVARMCGVVTPSRRSAADSGSSCAPRRR